MGTAKSAMAVMDSETHKVKIVDGGWTFSQKRKAKFLKKDPEKLTKTELESTFEDIKKQKK